MPALPINSTARLKFHYSTSGAAHTTVIRLADESAIAEATAGLIAYLDTLSSLFADSIGGKVEFSAEGSDFFFDVPGSAWTGNSWGGISGTTINTTQFAQMSGRSVGGKRVKFYVFGFNNNLSVYRVTSGEEPAVGVAATALNALSNSFLAIDGLQTVWQPYLNIKANDHWVHKVRS